MTICHTFTLTYQYPLSYAKKRVIMPDQENYGRFTPGAWNFIKLVRLTDEEQDMLRLMIVAKTETITLEEVKAML